MTRRLESGQRIAPTAQTFVRATQDWREEKRGGNTMTTVTLNLDSSSSSRVRRSIIIGSSKSYSWRRTLRIYIVLEIKFFCRVFGQISSSYQPVKATAKASAASSGFGI